MSEYPIKKQKFNLPDGVGGGTTYYFETSADKVVYLGEGLDIYLVSLDSRLLGQFSEFDNPKDKQIWFDATERKIKFYNAETGLWESFEVSSLSEPSNPIDKQIWFDVNERTVKIYNAETGLWESFEVSSLSEPSNPVDKQIWFDVNERTVKIYNAETGLWESFEIANSDEPTNPINNQTWFDVSNNTIKKYNAITGEWEIFIAKPVQTVISIPTSGWVLDSSETSEYKYFYEITVADLKPIDIVEIFYSRGSIGTVLEAGVCPSDNQAMSGYFRIYAAAKPTKVIDASYVVWKG